MAFSINAKLERGLNCAHNSLALQLPHVTREFPELANCYPGTLNLRLEVPLLVLVPDHRTKPIAWYPQTTEAETFDFLRMRLEAPLGAVPIPAWFYIAHWSKHRADLWLQEVVTHQKLKIANGAVCRVHIDRPLVQLPYNALPVVVILK